MVCSSESNNTSSLKGAKPQAWNIIARIIDMIYDYADYLENFLLFESRYNKCAIKT